MTAPGPPFKGSCHCRQVQFELLSTPQWLVSCNCSICSRLGALWAHADNEDVILRYDPGATIAYVWGEKTLAIHTCKVCGCTTHWENLDPDKYSRMGVNFRMCAGHDPTAFRLRHWDGADSFRFLD